MNEPLLSVALIVYNHEKFLEAAFEGVFNQVVDFDFEVVVSNDCSTDGSQKIIDQWREKFPKKIRELHNPKNLGMNKNWEKCIRGCKGKYVALLEGDDAWIAPHKLQQQIDCLETSENIVMCATNAKVDHIGSDNSHPDYANAETGIYGLKDLLQNQFIPTCTVVFKGDLLPESFPKYFYTSPMVDYLIHLMVLKHGAFNYVNECTGLYRLHSAGEWGKLDELGRLKHQLSGLQMAEKILIGTKDSETATKYKKDKLFQLATWHKENGQLLKYIQYRLRTRLAI